MFVLRFLAVAALFILASLVILDAPAAARPVVQTPPCSEITSPDQIPAPGVIDFDDLAQGAMIGDSYLASHGVRFEAAPATGAVINGSEPAKAHSQPNVASNQAMPPGSSSNVAMRIDFDGAKTHVGMWIGNGEAQGPTALLTGYDAQGNVVCQVRKVAVSEHPTALA